MANLEAYGSKVLGGAIESSSSSGHTIENASGTDMTQRDTLQFGGYLKTTDDSTNGKTVVSNAPTEISWDDWNELTPQEQAGHLWLINNAPDAGSGGHTIVDASGTDMTQRASLQFVDANVTDDSTDGATKVEVLQDGMSAADFDAASDLQDGVYPVYDESPVRLTDTMIKNTVSGRGNTVAEAVADTVSKSNGGTFNSDIIIDDGSGTASNVGWSYLLLGNQIPAGTAGNSAGVIRIQCQNDKHVELYDANANITANRYIGFQDKSGTLALTSDLSNPYVAVSGTTDEYCRCSYTVADGSTGTVLARIQDFISHLDTHSKLIMFDAIIYGSGQFRFSGYIYPNKNYGGGIFYAFNRITTWTRDNGTDTVKTL